jgi:hypothetical protein
MYACMHTYIDLEIAGLLFGYSVEVLTLRGAAVPVGPQSVDESDVC